MKNSPFKFHYNSFQSFFFIFVHFSPLSFKFIQLWPLHQLQLKLKKKNLENIFQSLIGYIFKYKMFEGKN